MVAGSQKKNAGAKENNVPMVAMITSDSLVIDLSLTLDA